MDKVDLWGLESSSATLPAHLHSQVGTVELGLTVQRYQEGFLPEGAEITLGYYG